MALQDSTNQNPTATSSTYWEEQTELDTWLPYEPRDNNAIGTVVGIFVADPDRYVDRRKSYNYVITGKGVQIQGSVESTVWLKHRLRTPVYTMDEYSEGSDYSLYDVVLRTDYGECYQAQLDSTGDPIWKKLDFPAILRPFVVLHAFAQRLDTDGQGEKAKQYYQMAYAALERASITQFEQQGIRENVRYQV